MSFSIWESDQSVRTAVRQQLSDDNYAFLHTALYAIGESAMRLGRIGADFEAKGKLEDWQKTVVRQNSKIVCGESSEILDLLKTDLVMRLMDVRAKRQIGGLDGQPLVTAVEALCTFAKGLGQAPPSVEPGSSQRMLEFAKGISFNAVWMGP